MPSVAAEISLQQWIIPKVNFLTQLLGGAKPLMPEQIEKLIALGRSLGSPGLYT